NAMENNLRRAITIDNGNWWTLIDSPLAIGLWTVAIVGFILPLIIGARVKAGMRRQGDEEGSLRD
ncbi:MAG: tripartite tricarboxylate transporter permease, partial [Sagittula sp.]